MDFLTTSEAADYLRIGERKLYELIAEGAVPCSKVAGKWLFPRGELDRWVLSGLMRPAGMTAGEPPPIVAGSQDDLLEWCLRQSGSGLATLAEGSANGVERLLRGEALAAAIHYHGASEDEDANVATVAAMPRLHDAVLIAFARREQGLLVPPGNPLGLASLADALAAGARIAMRQKGAGAQMLLEALLAQLGATPADVNRLEPPCLTGPDLAVAIRTGAADCGLATRAAARGAGLDFVPLVWENFDLLLRQRSYFQPPLQALAAFLAGGNPTRRAAELTGYDTSQAGRVRYSM